MAKLRRNLLFAFVGGHTLLWLFIYFMNDSGSLSDQSLSYLLVLLAHYLDTPARWIVGWDNAPRNAIAVFYFGTIQWTLTALIVSGLYKMSADKPRAADAADTPIEADAQPE